MFRTVLLILCLSIGVFGKPARLDGTVVFQDEKSAKVEENIITPPVLPVIEHLENDPTTLTKEDIEKKARKINNGNYFPKVGISQNFNYSPSEDGGVFITYSRGFSGDIGDDRNRAGSQSLRLQGSPDKGFKVEHSRSGSQSAGGNYRFSENSG